MRRVSLAVTLAVLASACAGCGSPTASEPGSDRPPAAPTTTPGNGEPDGVAGELEAEVATDAGTGVWVSWSWTNLSGEPVLVADRASGPTGSLSATSAYVVGLADDDVVQVTLRAFEQPADDPGDYAAPFYLGVTEAEPERTVSGELTVPSLEESKPYPDFYADGEGPVPDDRTAVVFCLGLLSADTTTRLDDDGRLVAMHGDVSTQTVVCADPVALG